MLTFYHSSDFKGFKFEGFGFQRDLSSYHSSDFKGFKFEGFGF